MPEAKSLPSIPNTEYSSGLIQSPAIDAKGKPTQRAIRDVGQAKDVVNTVIQANRSRNVVNARILAKYNAERPYNSQKLEAEGFAWRNNFTTKPLPSIIDKVAPRFTEIINGLKYLTNSELSDKWANASEKTEKFRTLLTKTIRARKGWRELLDDIAFTNALFGHVVVAWLDEFSWMPKAFMQDESFVSDGTKSQARLAQVIVLKEMLLPHELFMSIEDKESAETVGWNIKNTIDVINSASPAAVRDLLNVGGTQETWYQNAIRELTLGASYMAGASVVNVYSLFVREVTGKVSHYRLAGIELKEIFNKEDRFNSMEDCVAFFSFQRGNGTLHGSKGIGRDIYELAGMIDRSRNEIVDRSILSGKTIIQGDIKRIHTLRMQVVGATVVLPSGWTVLEQRFDGNVEPFLKLDAYFSMLIDQLIGSVSPPRGEMGEAFRSPVPWMLLAQREEEGRDSRISRFMEQFTDLIGGIQRRICDSDTTEDDAKELQKQLLEFMTREEINEISQQPVAGTVRDLTPVQRQLITMVANEKKGHPLYNQRALEVEDLTARVGTDFAKRVLLPENDPTEQVEQQRLQQMEAALLAQGQPVPVSPRDNHLIHLQALMPFAEGIGQAVMQGASDTAAFEATISHLREHYHKALESGVPKEQLQPFAEIVANSGPVLAQLKQLDAQAEELSQESQGLEAEQLQPAI